MKKIIDEISQASEIGNREDRIEAVKAIGINTKIAPQIAYLITIMKFRDAEDGIGIAIDGDDIEIYGKTYDLRNRIKDAGFAWMPLAKVWRRKNG